MATTQEEFDQLVKQLEAFSHQHPRLYRFQVALFAVLGYAYIFLVLVGLLALGGLMIVVMIVSHSVNGLILKLAVVLLIPVFVILRSLWVTFPHPQGLKLKRHQAPELFVLVDELTTKLQAPRFHNILLNREFNAAVVQVPRLGIFGWQQNYLLLGLPLMQAFSLEQLKAVLAHELGHLSGNHSRFAAWIYRVRKTWMQIYELLHRSDQGGATVLFNSFLNWYWPSFNAYSFVLARMNEYEADRCSVQLTGAQNMAAALINLALKGGFLSHCFWSDIHHQIERQPDPPGNVYSLMSTALQHPLPQEKSQQWLEQALAQKTNNADTHPCLSDRLKSLGYSTAQIQELAQSTIVARTAAEQLLGKTLQPLIDQFSQNWQQENSTPWRQRYAYLQEAQSKLQALAQQAETQPLTDQEVWEQAYYTLELHGEEAAVPLLQNVIEVVPEHAEANYILGQILLQKEDETGVAYLEKAIQKRMDFVLNGYQIICNFFEQRNQPEEAKKYSEKADQHYQILLKAQRERAYVNEQSPLKPHTLTASEVNDLKQQLAAYPEVKAAYLVEKAVQYFPEERFCVLGVVRKKGWLDWEDADQKLFARLAQTMQFPTQAYIIILNHRSFAKLQKKMASVQQSLIFQR